MTQDNNSDTVHSTQLLLNKVQADKHVLMRHIERQLGAEEKAYQMDRRMKILRNNTKSKLNSLDSMEKRIWKLKEQLNNNVIGNNSLLHSGKNHVDKELRELNSNAIIRKTTVPCTFCGKRFLRAVVTDHESMCSSSSLVQSNLVDVSQPETDSQDFKSKFTFYKSHTGDNSREDIDEKNYPLSHESNMTNSDDQNITTAEVRPQSPRNLRIVKTSSYSIELIWDPPILDGGLPIYDFEISYIHCIKEESGNIRKQKQRHETSQCSRWCLENPVPNNTYIMSDLNASTLFLDIKIRCRNEIGWSDYSIPIERCYTSKPSDPLPPQRFRVSNVTSKSITFIWSPPFHCGGGILAGYELSYVEDLPKENQELGSKNGQHKQREKVRKTVKITRQSTTYCLSGLHGDTLYSNINLRAHNNFYLSSTSASCDGIKTLQPTRQYIIEKEIERVSFSKLEYFDSDIFQNGVMQREKKDIYLAKLKNELWLLTEGKDGDKLRQPDTYQASTETNMRHISIRSKEEVINEFIENIAPDYQLRKSNFEFRIRAIRENITNAKTFLSDNATRRTLLVRHMSRLQERIRTLEAELDRLSSYMGKSVTSKVLHGVEQSYSLYQLKKEIRMELENIHSEISNHKYEVIQSQKKVKQTDTLIKDKENQLKDRMSAYQHFVRVEKVATNSFERSNRDINSILSLSILHWANKVQKRRRLGTLLNSILSKVVKVALYKWKVLRIDRQFIIIPNDHKNAYGVIGKGGISLIRAEADKQKIICLTNELVSDIYSLKKDLSLKKKDGGIHPMFNMADKLGGKDLVSYLKGKEFMENHQFDKAEKNLMTVMDNIAKESFYGELQIGDKTRLIVLLRNEIGHIQYSSNQLDMAIATFESTLFSSNFVKDDRLYIDALLSLGKCYIKIGNYSKAKEKFLEAISECRLVGDRMNEAVALKNIGKCYKVLGNDSYADLNMKKSHELFNHRNLAIRSALKNMDDLKKRLINVTAETGKVIWIQRVSVTFLKLTRNIRNFKSEISKKKEDLSQIETNIKNEVLHLEEMNRELNEAIATTEDSMESSFVHDNSQMIETRELIVRLKELIEEAKKKGDTLDRLKRSTIVDIKNLNDTVSDCKVDLQREETELIQRVLKKSIVRCMALNSSNAAFNDVTGLSRGGLDRFSLSIDKDIYIYDLNKGKVKSIFLGGDDGNPVQDPIGHTSIVTCMCFSSSRVYSGSVDTTIICWDMKGNKIFRGRGHEATVTCVAVKGDVLLSGSADTSIIFWDNNSGDSLKRIKGHARGVISVDCGISYHISGGIEGDILIWDSKFRCKHSLNFLPKYKMSVVKIGHSEIINGTNLGDVMICWAQTGEVLHTCRAHSGPVLDLQFDATKIVSCGMDCNIQIIDIMSGEILHTLRGHQSAIRSISFDSIMIISISCDWTIRKWYWNKSSSQNQKTKFYTLEGYESLLDVSKKNDVSIADLMKLNRIKNIRHVHEGQRIIVSKPDFQENMPRPTHKEKLMRNHCFHKTGSLCLANANEGNHSSTDIESNLSKRIAKHCIDTNHKSIKF